MDSEFDMCLLVLTIPRSLLGINNSGNIQSNGMTSKHYLKKHH